jgi:pimeloyl-ACP methyl ester carboxylesterase
MHTLRPLKALREAAAVPANAINRPLDIRFAIDHLTALNTDAAFVLHAQLDLARVGVAGHSFGAFTTMAIAGTHYPVLGDDARDLDPRVKAAIAMSTPTTQDIDTAFDDVKIPVFHMTGTKDESSGNRASSGADPIEGNTTAAERLRPFLHTKHAPAYLLVFEDGDHMVFSGRLTESRASDKEFQARVLSGSTAFWDAWLKDDKDARAWLDDGGFLAAVGKLGTFDLSRPQ